MACAARALGTLGALMGCVMLLVSLWLPWREEGFCPEGSFCIQVQPIAMILRRDFTAWEAFVFTDVLIAVAATASLALIVCWRSRRWTWAMCAGLGATAF